MLAQIKEDQGDIAGKEAGALICHFCYYSMFSIWLGPKLLQVAKRETQLFTSLNHLTVLYTSVIASF